MALQTTTGRKKAGRSAACSRPMGTGSFRARCRTAQSSVERTAFAGDNDLQCLIGYMISLFPENFPSMGKNYIEVKRIGDLILEEASRREPQNPFVKVLCTDEKVDKHNILMALAYIKERFKNCKEIASYFQRTLLS